MKSKYKPDMYSSEKKKMGYLVEECGEVLQASGKILRWGLDSVNPELPPEQQETNRAWLLRELQDLKYAVQLVENMIRPGG